MWPILQALPLVLGQQCELNKRTPDCMWSTWVILGSVERNNKTITDGLNGQF